MELLLIPILAVAGILWFIAPIVAWVKANEAKRLALENHRRLDALEARRNRARHGDEVPEGVRKTATGSEPDLEKTAPAAAPVVVAKSPVTPVADVSSAPSPIPQSPPAPVGTRKTVETPPPMPAKKSPEPETITPAFNWERFMGVNLFAWVGGLALFIGVVFLLKYSMDHGWVTPVMRAAAGYILGLGLVFVPLRLDTGRYRSLRDSLCATGILVLYAVTYACRSLWHIDLFSQPVSFATMSLITAGAFALAVRLDARVVAVLGLAGGFLTPVLLSTGEDNPCGLFGYIAVLDAGLIAVALRKRWNFLPALGVIGTIVLQWCWWDAFYAKGGYAATNDVFIPMTVFAGLAALFAGACLVARHRDGVAHSGFSISALAVTASAFIAGCGFVFSSRLETSPLVAFAYVFLCELVAIVIAVADRRKSFSIPVAGGATFLLLAAWTTEALDAGTLSGGLVTYLLFGALHTGIPMLLKKAGKLPEIPTFAHIAPVLTLLLALWASGTSSGLPVIAALLAINILALALAAVSRRLVVAAVTLPLTFLASTILFRHVSENGTGLAGWLATLAIFSLLFIIAGMMLGRFFRNEDNDRSPDAAIAALMPAASALLPFLLLTMATVRVEMESPLPVFGFAAGLVAVLLTLGRTIPAGALVPAALGGVLLVETSWFSIRFTPAIAGTSLLWALGFCAAFLIYPFVFSKTFSGKRAPWIAAAVSLVAHFAIIRTIVSTGWPNALQPGVLPLLFAIPAFAATALARKIAGEDRARNARVAYFAGAGLLFVTTSIGLQFHRESLTIAWALEGCALIALFRKVPHRGLLRTGSALLGVAFVRLALNPAVLGYHIRGDVALWNWYLYAYPLVALSLSVSARLLPKDWKPAELPASGILRAMSAGLLFLLLNLEIADAFSAPGTRTLVFEFSGNLARDMSYSLGWGVFALAMLIAGIVKKARPPRLAGIALLGVTLLKVFLHDLANLDDLYRIGAFIGVALIAIAASFLYQRFSKET